MTKDYSLAIILPFWRMDPDRKTKSEVFSFRPIDSILFLKLLRSVIIEPLSLNCGARDYWNVSISHIEKYILGKDTL